MTKLTQVPEIIVSDIRYSDNYVDVAYSKSVPTAATNNPFSRNFQLSGHPNAQQRKDKTLMVWSRYHDVEKFRLLGWNVGDNVNEKSNNPVIVDIIEYETTQLTKSNGLDNNGKVRVEPVINPTTNGILKSVDGKMFFRFVDFVYADTLEELADLYPAKPTVDRLRGPFGMITFDDEFEGTKHMVEDGKNRMTLEYQNFLQQMYTAHNSDTLVELNQEVNEELPIESII